VRYRELLNPERVTRIYLNELGNVAEQSLGIQAVNLVIESEQSAVTRARELINQARQQIFSELQLREFLQLIEAILVYKLPNTSREELEAMFSLDELKQTRYFQDVKQEGLEEGRLQAKLEAVPRFLALGLSAEQVAEALDLNIETVRQAQASAVQNIEPTEEV
jgi:predicted transposase/invertase (TIGR01784 family)